MRSFLLEPRVLAGIIIGLSVPFLFSVAVIPSESAIPPTPAFMNIATNDTSSATNPAWVNATRYDDNLWIITDGSILIEVIDYDGNPE